jgi:hypothetical protein
MEIYKKLGRIQEAIKGLSKDKKSHNYAYVSGNRLLSFLKPLMDKEGLILKTEITDIQNVRQDYKVWDKWTENETGGKGIWKQKNEILTTIKMLFTWIDIETGEKDENQFAANGQNDWEKGLGSALTYGERYFLLKYFHIQTDKDDVDNPDRKDKQNSKLEKKELTETQLIFLKALNEVNSAKELSALCNPKKAFITMHIDLLTAYGAKKKELGI